MSPLCSLFHVLRSFSWVREAKVIFRGRYKERSGGQIKTNLIFRDGEERKGHIHIDMYM